MSKDRFHPQFRGILNLFQQAAPSLFLRFGNNMRANSQSADRLVALDESLSFNASVGRANDGYARYTFTAGAVASLFDLSRTLCATTQFVPEIPVTGKAMETRITRDPSHFLDYNELIGSRGQPLPLIPLREVFNDPGRDALALLFLDLLFRFLMLHEQMHFVRGHLHYLYGATSPRAYDEIPSQSNSPIENSDRRALELDADGSALNFMMETVDQDMHHNIIGSIVAKLPGTEGPLSLFRDRWGWWRIVDLAAVTVMMLLSLGDPGSLVHPRPATRMLSLLLTAVYYIRKKGYLKKSEMPPASFHMLYRDVAVVAMTLNIEPPAPEAVAEWNTADPNKYRHPACIELRDLMGRLDTLVPKLR
jgi:hypothetical protein